MLSVSPCSLNLEMCSGLVTLGQSAIKPAEQECVPSVLPAELLSQLQLLRVAINQSCVYKAITSNDALAKHNSQLDLLCLYTTLCSACMSSI